MDSDLESKPSADTNCEPGDSLVNNNDDDNKINKHLDSSDSAPPVSNTSTASSGSSSSSPSSSSKQNNNAEFSSETQEIEAALRKVSLDVSNDDSVAINNNNNIKNNIETPKIVKEDSVKKSKQQPPPGQVLKDTTIESLVDYIKSGQCKNVICMVGAGISTSAGIPDFRSPNTGLFSQLAKYNLPFPEAVFDLNFFKSNPKPFFHLARELFPGNFQPTPTHYFMKLLHDKDLLLRLYTQNIDSLERLAGVPSDKLIEAHGTFNTAHCINKRCKKEYSLEWMKKIVLDHSKVDNVARCEECNGYVKPDIIFYGEILPDRFYNLIESDFAKCDLLLIMGTSLTVQPFASLVEFVRPHVPRLLINKVKPEGAARGKDISLFKAFLTKLTMWIAGYSNSGPLDFTSKSNKRNVFMKSETDLAAHKLAEMLQWKQEFQQLLQNNNNSN